MKIRKITISNLNSLYGTFQIDLTGAYYDSGLFLIKGDKGSGKSTILDAVCLAIYGETPRLGKKNLDILSQGEKNGFAEVEFELNDEIYTVRYGITKKIPTRGANKGVPKYDWFHTLQRGSELLAERSATLKVIGDLLGIKFDDFTRVILLAQGNFNAFLTSGKEKGEILEKITGTEIYSKMGTLIFESWKESKEKVERKRGVIGEIRILSEEEILQLENERSDTQRKLDVLRSEIQTLEGLCLKFDQIREKDQGILNLERELAENFREIEAFAQSYERLKKGKLAASVASEQKAWREISQERETKEKERANECQKERREREGSVQAQAALENAVKVFQEAEKESLSQTPILNQVRALDAQLKTMRADLDALRVTKETRRKEILLKKETLSEKLRQEEEWDKTVKGSQLYLEEYSIDQGLERKIPEWKGDLNRLQALLTKMTEYGKEASSFLAKSSKLQFNIAQLEQNGKEVRDLIQIKQNEIEANEAEILTLLDGKTREHWRDLRLAAIRELSLVRTIEDLAAERKNLEDGKPCPLCGSLHHPYAKENVPRVDDAQKRIDQIERIFTELERRDESLRKMTEERALLERRFDQIQSKLGILQKEWEHCQTNWKRREEDILTEKKLAEPIEQKIQEEFSVFSFNWDRQPNLPIEVQTRYQRYQEHRNILDEAQKKMTELNAEIVGIKSALEVSEAVYQEAKEDDRQKESQLQKVEATRQALYGEKDPNVEEEGLKCRIASSTERKETAQKNLSEAKARLETTQIRIQELKGTIRRLLDQENALFQIFVRACEKIGITPEDYSSMVLSPEEMTQLIAKQSRLETQRNHLEEEKKKWTTSRDTLIKEIPESIQEESLRQEWNRKRVAQDELNQTLGELNNRIVRGQEDRDRRLALEEELRALQVDEEYWGILNKILGGENGAKFRRLAQEHTLGQLLDRANRELMKMDGRYELIPGEVEGDLEIDVCDHWQDDTFRSAKNLSGGEQFIVSLALALGLSAMVGDKLQIDSLFLDEGFGTLDERALDQVVRALYTLQEANGKTIGIISHVEALAESDTIQTSIQVTPIGNGRSILEGPGVRRL